MSIKQNRIINLSSRIFMLKDIRAFAVIIFEEYKNVSKELNTEVLDENGIFINFLVRCSESKSFKSNDISILDESSIINNYRMRSIEIEFKESKNKHIKLKLVNGSIYNKEQNLYYTDSEIEIEGNEYSWVTNIEDKFEGAINNVTPQEDYVKRFGKLIYLIAFIVGTIAFGFIFDLLNKIIGTEKYIPYWKDAIQTKSDFALNVFCASFLGGFIFGSIVSEKVKKFYDYYPLIELQVGPEHLLIEKIKKNHLRNIIIYIAIPIIVSIVSYFITKGM